MFVLHPEAAGTVVALLGKAVARGPDGSLRMLGVGDRVNEDEVVLTAQLGHVQLAALEPRRLAALSTASPKLITLPGDDLVVAPEPLAPSLAAGAPAVRLAALSVATPKPITTASREPAPVVEPPVAETPGSGLQAGLRLDSDVAFGATAASALASLAAPDATVRAYFRPLPTGDRLAPTAETTGQRATEEDTPMPISLAGRDPDGRIAQVFIVKVPTGGLLYRADGVPIADRTGLTPEEARELVFVPAPHFQGNPGPLQYMVQDASGKLSAVATVAISVSPVNDAPVPGTTLTGPDFTPLADADPHHLAGTTDYRWATAADTPVFGQVNATDVDGDPFVFAASTAPAHGQVLVAADGSFVYTPDAGWLGADRFVVAVDDGRGGRATSTVFIDVTAPGATPARAAPDADAAAAAAAVPPEALAEASPLAQPLDNPLGFDEIFGRAHAERAATHQAVHGSAVEADVLQLSALLTGHLPMAVAEAHVPERLDLGLDWGLRANGFDWLKNPTGQTPG